MRGLPFGFAQDRLRPLRFLAMTHHLLCNHYQRLQSKGFKPRQIKSLKTPQK
jgi:hypothetical protein